MTNSDPLGALAAQIQDQFGVGETQTNALSILKGGQTRSTQTLGDYSQKFDQTDGRKYLEEGYLRLDPYNVLPKAFEILWQEPSITLLVKKRAFSTLAEHNRPDYADVDERLFYKASKILFQNKCRQIAALEKLSKISRVSQAAGALDIQLLPIIISLVDQASSTFPSSPLSSNDDSFLNSSASAPFKQLVGVIDKIRQVYAFSDEHNYTTWITDPNSPFQSDLYQGTGVIEITNLISFNSTTSLRLNGGNCSFQIVDPYKCMTVTNSDIEWALLDATNAFANSPIFQLGKDSLDKIAAQNINLLNTTRTSRGAGSIDFMVNPDLSIGQQVAAIISNIGEAIHFTINLLPDINNLGAGGVSVSSDSLLGGPLEDAGLDPKSEVPLFQATVSAMYNSIKFKQTAQTNINQNSQLTNYARQKLRFHYAKKPIVQIMDQVHIYISSKSQLDNKILGGLQGMFTGLGFLQQLNNNVFDLKNQITTLFNPSQNIDLQLEKSVFVGSNFPTALWVMMRNIFVSDRSGCHVFAGVVNRSNRHFSEGKWVVSVNCADNSSYLDYSVVNLNPGVDQFNGPIYDPLTPFVTKFDAVSSNSNNQTPTLLPENQDLLNLQNNSSGMIRFNSGRNAGQPATLTNFFGDKELSNGGVSRNVYYAPNGLVYKWKEGIGVLTQFGDSFNSNRLRPTGIPAITQNPLAGQDVMNVISLYITGVPYNYATYYDVVSKFDTFGRNPQSGQSGAASFYGSLTNDLKKRNMQWGDFLPFKSLVVDEQTFIKMLDTTLTIKNTNNQIDQLLQQIQDTQNKLTILQKSGDITSFTVTILKNDLDKINANLQANLKAQTDAVHASFKNSNTPISLIGSDVSYDPSQLQTSQSFSLSDPKARREVRRTTNFLTRRMPWQIRANDDKNLFIVDDSYDKDYDIIAFEESLATKLNQYTTEYSTVADKILLASNLLNLEVFADSQGHIRARAPQYNRMPSSVFYRMMQLKQQTGIQFFPQFLEDLFVNNINASIVNLKVIEDQIRLDGAILGKNSDSDIINFITGQQVSGSAGFQFVSKDDDSRVVDATQVLSQDSPDITTSSQNTFTSVLNTQGSLTSVFTAQTRAQAVQDLLKQASTTTTSITTTFTSTRINDLQQRIFKESGQQVVLDNFAITPINSIIATPTNGVDVFKVTKDLADKLATRQKIIKQAAGAIKNAQEVRSLDVDNNTANQLLFPNLYGNSEVPEIFENMIEDESYDDLGPGSGKRYIIHNYQIKSIDISENPPDYTMIEVSGQLDPLLSNNNLPAGLASFPSGGNGLITAVAIDYDLWRMYGWKAGGPIQVPFLSNPQTQCAPYAASLLSRARRSILHGSVTIMGNEFMQAGEVIYVEDEDLLFYIEAVSHDYASGSDFVTRLELTYGHNPGEYIPTSLDVIGKMLYNTTANLNTGYANYRQSNVFNESHLGSIIINDGISDITAITGGNYGAFNTKIISNILFTASSAVTQNSTIGNNVQPIVELRIFYNGSMGLNNNLNIQASNLQDILTGKAVINTTTPNIKLDRTLPKENVSIATIDISNTSEHRSPTQSAWDLARKASATINTGSSASSGAAKDQQTIYNIIIDCVMVFNNIATTPSNSASSGTATSTTTSAGQSSNTSNPVAPDISNISTTNSATTTTSTNSTTTTTSTNSTVPTNSNLGIA